MRYDKTKDAFILTKEEAQEITEQCNQAKALAEQLEQLERLQMWLPSGTGRRLLN